MAGEMNEMSLAIGRLEAVTGTLTAEVGKLRNTVHQINNDLTVVNGIDERVTALEIDSKESAKFRNRALGVAAGVGVGAGAAGSHAFEWIKRLFGT